MPAPRTTATAAPAPATPAQASLYQQLRGHLAELKMHDAAGALPAVLDTAAAEGLTLTAALEQLLAIEVTASQARRLAGRLRFASLPTPATLEDFDYDAAPAIDPKLIAELATCRYLENATNVLLIGPPGLGKTHLAVGLARKAAEAGYRAYFTTAADLAARCHRAAIEGRWATTMRFFNGPGLLVIDELGYLPLPAEAASALFQVISQRYLKTSIILTSNQPAHRRSRIGTQPLQSSRPEGTRRCRQVDARRQTRCRLLEAPPDAYGLAEARMKPVGDACFSLLFVGSMSPFRAAAGRQASFLYDGI